MAEAVRNDVSEMVALRQFQGVTLTGPTEYLSRKIPCSNQSLKGTTQFNTVNFRILGSGGKSMMRSRVVMVLPLRFSGLRTRNSATPYQAQADAAQEWSQAAMRNIGLRRSAVMSMIRQIAVTVNSTSSQSTRPDDWLTATDDLFMYDKYGGSMCGEGGVEGGRYDAIGILRAKDGGQNTVWPDTRNPGFSWRLRKFREGASADLLTVDVDLLASIPLAPFLHYTYPSQYRNNPAMIPFTDNIDLQITFKSDVKPWVLQCTEVTPDGIAARAIDEFDGFEAETRTIDTTYAVGDSAGGYKLEWKENPYLKCQFVTSEFSIPQSISLPSTRLVSYRESVNITQQAAQGSAVVRFNQVRLESFPSLVQIWAEEDVTTRAAAGPGWKPTFCPIVEGSLRVNINERANLLSGTSNYELFKYYKRNSSSKVDYEQWSTYRPQILIRNDMLGHTSQNVFDPCTMNLQVEFKKPRFNEHKDYTGANNLVCRMNFWYFSESLTLSSQSSAQSSLLLDQSQVNPSGSQASQVQTSVQAYAYS